MYLTTSRQNNAIHVSTMFISHDETCLSELGNTLYIIVQELCESRGGHPGLSVLTSLLVSVGVKLYWTMLRHWSLICQLTSEGIKQHYLPTYLLCISHQGNIVWSLNITAKQRHNGLSHHGNTMFIASSVHPSPQPRSQQQGLSAICTCVVV